MRKLLSANFARLWKDKAFWITGIAVLALSLVGIWNSARSAETMTQRGYIKTLEDYYFGFAPYMGAVYAVFISLFLGTEYSDGTVRNKLTVGHTRKHVYLVNYLVSFAACLFFVAAWFIGGMPGLVLIGPFEMGVSGFLVYLLVAVCFTAALAAVSTWISATSTNKAMTVVLTFLVWLYLSLLSGGLNDRLLVPEMASNVVYIDGELTLVDPTPNPLYLSGAARLICECLLDLLPTGQAMLMMDAAIERPVRQMVFSAIFTLVALVGGYAAFRRKNIK